MFKLRHAVAAVALATGGIGCATFCDECDDFPIPGQFAAMPGSYTGPPLQGDARRDDVTLTMPSPTTARGVAESFVPNAPQSDDGSGSSTGGAAANIRGEGVAPPPPPPMRPLEPVLPRTPDANLPQLP
ncbi:hypothetical protein [Paludisphaera rhizosphaerae]|uniref:hypothetical protein n=1 Tax=Paludisphaera rhizosphaerae TaxID=2711216 RepID=UPI0013ED5FD3|nr:hypothetical protein [Paludisphaera rhizosphaerae]